mmetsp:Transcript_699/g.1612  ORF Transcript_699/g.1612 Transcript_699/m.1612 type:complete len:270 (-) Transcript_699:917-1726(-)
MAERVRAASRVWRDRRLERSAAAAQGRGGQCVAARPCVAPASLQVRPRSAAASPAAAPAACWPAAKLELGTVARLLAGVASLDGDQRSCGLVAALRRRGHTEAIAPFLPRAARDSRRVARPSLRHRRRTVLAAARDQRPRADAEQAAAPRRTTSAAQCAARLRASRLRGAAHPGRRRALRVLVGPCVALDSPTAGADARNGGPTRGLRWSPRSGRSTLPYGRGSYQDGAPLVPGARHLRAEGGRPRGARFPHSARTAPSRTFLRVRRLF